MSYTTGSYGRLCNQIIRNLAMSILAQKFNLFVQYSFFGTINEELGIPLFVGTVNHKITKLLTDDNFFDVLNNNTINYNLNPRRNYFQTKEISQYLYNHLRQSKENIICKNPYKERYQNNNDIFIHVRLGDATKFNPGLEYYLLVLKDLTFDNIFIASDSLDHDLITSLKKAYPIAQLVDKSPTKTIQFGSTCKYIILSHGSFSAIIGYLGFYSIVYYPKYERSPQVWCGDMFSIPDWHEV